MTYHEFLRLLRRFYPDKVVEMNLQQLDEAALVMSDRKWKKDPVLFLIAGETRNELSQYQQAIRSQVQNRVRNERPFYMLFHNGCQVRFVSSIEQVKGSAPESIICVQ